MLVRVNVPHWGFREVRGGAAALIGLAGGAPDALADRIRQEVGHRPFELVASARAGLVRAAHALGLKDRRVAVPAYVCPAVSAAMRMAQVELVAVDCAPGSFGLEPDGLLAAARAGDIAAVVAPSTYGAPQDQELLRRSGLPWIEDAAYQGGQTSPAGHPGGAGLAGHAGVWSFNFKTLTGVGGGVVFLPAVAVADLDPTAGPWPHGPGRRPRSRAHERALFANYVLRTIGRHRIPHWLPGGSAPRHLNEHRARASLDRVPLGSMSELQAAVALAQWGRREEVARRASENAERIRAVVADSPALTDIAPAARRDSAAPSFPHLYPVLLDPGVPDPERSVWSLRSWLHQAGVQTEDPYPLVGGQEDGSHNAAALRRRLLLVPCHASITDGVMRRVAAVLTWAAERLVSSL